MEEIVAYRCGCSDAQRALADRLDARWRRNNLSYYIAAYVPGLDPQVSDQLIEEAFASWMAVGNIRIARTLSREGADLTIATGRGQRANFDGPGGVQAWAQLPSGDDRPLLMRFDADENWTIELFRAVAAHEIGHLLGLDHSRDRRALMYPYVNLRIYNPQPHDDIPRFQELYGPPVAVPPPPPVGPDSTDQVVLYSAGFLNRWFDEKKLTAEQRKPYIALLTRALSVGA